MNRLIFSLFLLSMVILGAASCGRRPPPSLVTDSAARLIRFAGKIYPHRYNTRADRAQGHHFIVWSGGANAAKALIQTEVSDQEILKALEAVGAAVGNNLTEATWDQRADPTAAAPDERVMGSLLDIRVEWGGQARPLHDLFQDKNPADYVIRAGGHEKWIPVWRSGCVTCLFSCPGGKTSNAAFTIRDQYLNRKTFLADEGNLPPDGAPVRVCMRIMPE